MTFPQLSRLLFVILALGFIAPSNATTAAPVAPRTTIDCRAAAPGGHLLIQEHTAAGRVKVDLVVADPADGAELGRITMPQVDVVFPTTLPNRALAVAGSDLYLIDSVALTAQIVPMGDDSAAELSPNPVQFRGTAGDRFMLLGSPSFDRTFLIDVEQGVAINLGDLIAPPAPDAPVFISFAAVTPDDAHVLLWDGRHVYVVAVDNPTAARQLDAGAFAFAPDFSPDGQSVIYSSSDGPGSGSTLILVALDGSYTEVIKASEHALVTLWVPQTNTLLVDERTESGAASGAVYLLNLDTGAETPLLSYDGSLTTVQFSPDGAFALFGVEMMGSGSWFHVDLSSGEVDEVAGLLGSRIVPGLYADLRWALAIPFGDDGDALSGPVFRGFDLQSGEVGRILEQPDGMDFVVQPVLSNDGRRSLVIGQLGTRSTIWLLDAIDLRAVELAEGVTTSGLFSPDGCHVAVAVQSAIDGIPSYATRTFAGDGEPLRSIGSGAVLAWLDS